VHGAAMIPRTAAAPVLKAFTGRRCRYAAA
jgi:hypothetical protein